MDEIVQGSPEWLALRLGKVTASRVADVVAKTKSGPSASRTNYMAELIAERLIGVLVDRFTNAAMDWGTANEADARIAYEFWTDTPVTEVGFLPHPDIGMTGASPDGLVGAGGLVEIKCPNTATHLDTLLGQAVPGKYITQMMWQMACTDREWCDFVSYDPRLPEAMRLFVKRVHRDDILIADLEKEVIGFLNELHEKITKLQALYEGTAAPDLLAAG